MKITSFIAISALTLALTGCGSEYAPDEISVSPKGTFVKKGSDSEINGTFVLEKVTGESLTVEIDDGLPDGDVEMSDEKGKTILRSSFKPNDKQNNSGSGFQFINAMLAEAAGNASTNDYLRLFERFAEYDGDYLEVDHNKQRVEGNYESGEKIGRWKKYCENKQLASDQTFKKFSDGDKSIIQKIGDDLAFTCNGDVILQAKRDKKGRLQGKYIENHYSAYSLFSKESDEQTPLKPKYVYQYKDGEFDGLQKKYSRDGIIAEESNYTNGVLDGVQKKYDREGKISLENNYKNSVKDGTEKVYSANQNYTTKEITRWLSEVKNYSNGALNGKYQKFDSKQRELELGAYANDKPIGQWVISSYKYNTKTLHDYDASNFTLEKQKAFKEACRLPSRSTTNLNWSKDRDAPTTDCQYYIENGLVDINKKILIGSFTNTFERSTTWTYPAIVAKPNIYNLMKQAGVKTDVTDSEGQTRLHYCITQFRQQSKKRPRCDLKQLEEYAKGTNLNSVSNIGTVFHQLASKYGYMPKWQRDPLIALEKEAMDILIAHGGKLNQVNHAGKTPFMAALENGNYDFAENAINAGASVKGADINGKSVLGHFFTKGNRLKNAKLKDNVVRILAKAIALGLDTQAPVLNGKTIKELSEENNTLFHIQTIKDATAMSSNFEAELKQRPVIDDSEVVSQTQEPQVPSSTTSTENQTNASEEPQKSTLNDINSAVDDSQSSQQLSEDTKPVVNDTTSTENSSAAQLLQEQANSLGTLEQLKKIDPNNENISLIQEKIGKKYLSLASGKINNGQKASAQSNLNSAKEFINDDSLIAQYQTKINNITSTPINNSSTTSTSNTTSSSNSSSNTAALACDPVIKLAGIPLIGGQSLTAQQSLPLSADSALRKALSAVQKTYQNVRQSGKKITYEQSTSTKPITFTLTVSKSGNYSQINVKAKTPAGIVIKKSGYKQGFCETVQLICKGLPVCLT